MPNINETTSSHIVHIDDCEIDLKNRYLAAVLAILLPGAGHYYQGRRNKAYLFAVCVLGLFVLGMFLGNGKVVYAAWGPEEYRIQFAGQVFVGAPALPAVLQAYAYRQQSIANREKNRDIDFEPWFGGFMAPPRNKNELNNWHEQTSAGFELGTLYTAVAGLLNLLVVFDAFAGPMPLPHTDERRGKRKTPPVDDEAHLPTNEKPR